jgi:prepilin-type N-terminal cleavage/methylation domain-containing protein
VRFEFYDMRILAPARWSRVGVRARAFTLVEMIVVVVVMAILTALVIPEMRGSLEDALLRASAREVVDACGIAQSRAVSLNQVHRIRFDPVTGHFQLERRVRGARGGGGFVRVRDVPDGHGQIDDRISVQSRPPGLEAGGEAEGADAPRPRGMQEGRESAPPMALVFHPDGTAEGDDIVLRDRSGFGLAVQVNPVTGRMRVTEVPRR